MSDVRKSEVCPLEANANLLASKFSAIPAPFLRYLAAQAAKSSKEYKSMLVLAPLGLVTLVRKPDFQAVIKSGFLTRITSPKGPQTIILNFFRRFWDLVPE